MSRATTLFRSAPILLALLFQSALAISAGDKDGPYEERDDDGNLVMKAAFVKGKLDGPASYYENGKLVRRLTFKAGAVVHERALEEIRDTLQKIEAPVKDEHERALHRLMAYRYLARVPYADLALDPGYAKYAQAASKICKELGRLEHQPKKNPGWPEDEFKIAQKGAMLSSLAGGYPNLVKAMDGWMFDSDDGNVRQLGHRRWCINPPMKKTAFGRTDEFYAMYYADMSRKVAFDFVAYPAPGYMPAGYFSSRQAWNVSLNLARYRQPDKKVKPSIYPLDELGKKQEALKLDVVNVDPLPFGIPHAIIFRPAKLDTAPGRRYLVEIEGVAEKGKKESVLRYVVEFAGK
jgi:hypothetical protein